MITDTTIAAAIEVLEDKRAWLSKGTRFLNASNREEAARIDAALQELKAWQPGEWQPLADGEMAWGNVIVRENGTLLDIGFDYDEAADEYDYSGYLELPDDVKICQRQRMRRVSS